MKIYRFFENCFLTLLNCLWVSFIRIHELKNILKKRKLYKNIKLTTVQKRQIDNFYKKYYGKKIPYAWHKLYTSYTGKFDYKYVPEYIFSTKVEMLGNKRINVLPFENKILLNTFFEGASELISIPKVYLSRINGKYFDYDNNPISESDALNILNKKYKDFIIKVSIDSNSGRGVDIVHLKDGIDIKTKKNLKMIFKEHGKNFVVTELVKQSEIVNKIYSDSINTLRVITYVTDTGYHVAPIVMRIGQGGNNVDNAHAGGMFISVDNNGNLGRLAFTEYQRKFNSHPDTGLVFEKYKLPNIDILVKEIIKLHKKIPHIMFVSWDIAIKNDNNFSLIESNLHSQAIWLPQMAHGVGFFGDNTDYILSMLKGSK